MRLFRRLRARYRTMEYMRAVDDALYIIDCAIDGKRTTDEAIVRALCLVRIEVLALRFRRHT
jgi:hypothetical protein